LVRSVDGRVEWRLPDPSANVYAALAATLSAGLLGMDAARTPPPPIDEDLYDMSVAQQQQHQLRRLPSDLGQALNAFGQDEPLRRAMGHAFCKVYEAVKQQEWQEWQAAVTDWETRRYGTWC
jgi:glutamine synthetase